MNIEVINHELGIIGKVFISKSAYIRETLIKVAYECTDYFYVFISEDDNNFIVHLSLKNNECGNAHTLLTKVCGDFVNNLIDQEMRFLVQAETKDIREVIIKAAFSEAAKGLKATNKALTKPNLALSYVDDKLDILSLRG